MAGSKAGGRLSLSQATKDSLWSESGGYCQNPACRADLHSYVDQAHLAEMAHIIPASAGGRRAAEGPDLSSGERALPENILVLCPTRHTVVDKNPVDYPGEVLHEWKRRSLEARAVAHGTPVFASRPDARAYVEPLLASNQTVFELYGPRDELFDDARAEQWQRHEEVAGSDPVTPTQFRRMLITYLW